MAKGGKKAVKMSGSWKEALRQLTPSKYNRTLDKHVRRATEMIGRMAAREMQNVINRGNFQKNASLTTALKGHGKPLVHTGAMRSSITHKMLGKRSVFVGVLRSDGSYMYAKTVHGTNARGATIRVTPAMRGMFMMLAKVSGGQMSASKLTGRAAELYSNHSGPWFPLRMSTTQIRIPPRPFVNQLVANKAFLKRVKGIWQNAIAAAHREMVQQTNRKGQRA